MTETKTIIKEGTILPQKLIADKLNKNEVILLYWITKYGNTKMNVKELAKMLGLEQDQVETMIGKLVKLNYINLKLNLYYVAKERRKGNYYTRLPPIFDSVIKSISLKALYLYMILRGWCDYYNCDDTSILLDKLLERSTLTVEEYKIALKELSKIGLVSTKINKESTHYYLHDSIIDPDFDDAGYILTPATKHYAIDGGGNL